MKRRTTMLMSALFAAGAFALNGNVAKADNVQAVNNNNANSTEVKQNTGNADSSELNVASAQTKNDQANNQEASTKSEPDNKELTQDADKFNIAAVKHSFGEDSNIKVPNEEALEKEATDLYSKYMDQKDENERNTTSTYDSPFVSTGEVRTMNLENLTNPNSEKLDDKDVDWNKVGTQLKNAKEKVDHYLDTALNENTSYLPTAKKDARDSIKDIAIPTASEIKPNYNIDLDALKGIYNTISFPYLATLFDFRGNEGDYVSAIGNSDYKDQSNDYVNKLAELVARNVKKDKEWVLFNTNPFVPTAASYVINPELIKIDRDAYNRNHGIKSDENTSDNKNQSTTDTKKDQSSQNVTDNTTSNKDQSSEKVTNDTTSKKDQSTTNTSSNTNQTTESKSSTISSKTTSDTKTPVAKNEGSNTKTTDVVKSKNKATENTASVVKNDTKAATEKTTDVKVVAPAKKASNEVKTTDAAAKASDAHVVALNSKVNAGTASTTPAAAAKGSQSKATENKLPQAGTDEKISLFASLAGLSIASLGLGALGASKKRKND
ncbi:hypothetical protein E6A54_00990 [Lactobacillus johnsonii]|uniref:hypothetical protein n=1 Tax=Lactobacillus johnsonii TaxID=33959 RepID=UPI0013034509|nr:hypothetical protein [Lactobacillus johnsonii]QGY95988.1 hypothetical protein E6A54_00990 [Lactobacillus johnsonii]